jgi:outer membrane protein assembly factor BamB
MAMLLIGVVVWLAFLPGAPDTFLRPPVHVYEAILLPAPDPSSPPDAAALVYDIFAEQYLLARLDPVRHRIAWRGPAMEGYSFLRGLASASGAIYITENAQLLAFDAGDGHTLWKAALTDNLGYCAGCLSAVGNRVLALTEDYTLQAFDAATGETAWSRRLAGYTSRMTVVGESLLVIDQEDEAFSLFRLSAADGRVEWKITPACKGAEDYSAEQLDSGSTVVVSPEKGEGSGDRSVFLIYGWNPACVERRDFATGAVRWQHYDEQGYSPSDDYAVLLTDAALFFGAGNDVWSVDTASGTARRVLSLEDYEPVPIALAGDTLIVRLKRTRGSTQFGLRGMDPANGEKYWELVLDKGAPLEPPDTIAGLVDDAQTAFILRVQNDRLALVEFEAEPEQMRIRWLDPKSGEAIGENILPLEIQGDFYAPPVLVAWSDPVLWVTVENRLLGLDLAAGKPALSYP